MTAARQGLWALALFLGAVLAMVLAVLALVGYLIGVAVRSL
jgi:hypothetical protein